MHPTANGAALIRKNWMLNTLNARRVMPGVRHLSLMDMSKRQFRLLLILNWALPVVAFVIFFLTLEQLPRPLREYFDSQSLPSTLGRFYAVVWLNHRGRGLGGCF